MNLNIIEKTIEKTYQNESSGHDYFHLLRVKNLAVELCETDDDQEYIAGLALMHEVMDEKLKDLEMDQFVQSLPWSEKEKRRMLEDISTIGFKGGFKEIRRSREAQIVTEADYLDAMGAIGIARTFQYNGAVKKAPLFDPNLEMEEVKNEQEYRLKSRNAIAHFDEKLLRLKDYFVTTKGKAMAEIRHQTMVNYLEAFYHEMAEANFISKKHKNHV